MRAVVMRRKVVVAARDGVEGRNSHAGFQAMWTDGLTD